MNRLTPKLRWAVERGIRIKAAGALHRAAQYGLAEALRILLDAGAYVEDSEEDDEGIDSALMKAVRKRLVDVVKLLVKRGANVELKNRLGETPLNIAAAGGVDQVSVIMEKHRVFHST